MMVGMDSAVVASVLLALLLYINTLPADFAYDDSRAILKNPDLQNDSPLINLFYNDFWGTPLTHSGSHKSYRPLCVLTFRLNHYLGGLKPFGYHLGNVILHAVVTGLFTHVARLLLRRPMPTLVAGLLFASHPIHTEAVAGVVGRADMLACLFFLLAFLCYMRYCKYRDKPGGTLSSNHARSNNYVANSRHSPNSKTPHKQFVLTLDGSVRWRYLVATAVLTAVSMLSKEQGITVLAICATYDIFLHSRISVMQLPNILKGRHKGVLEGIVSLAVMGFSFLSLRVYFMGNKPPEFAPADNPASDSDSQLTRALTFTYLPFFNFWLLLFPTTLSFDWSMEAIPLLTSLSDPRNLCSVTFYSVLAYGIWYIICHLNVEKKERLHNGNGFMPHINSSGNSHNHNNHGGNHVVSNKNSSGLRKRLSSRRGSNSSSNSDSDDSSSDTSRLYSTRCKPLHVLMISLALVVFPFLPATNIFFYVGFVVAERVLYMPSMGFCLLVAEGAYLMWSRYCSNSHGSGSGLKGKSAAGRHLQGGTDSNRRTLLILGISLLVAAYSVRTVLRNQDWLTEENLYKAGISVNPAKAWGNLANILNNQGRTDEAEQAYRSALRHRGNMADVHYNLGILLQEQKRYQEAIDSYLMAIKCRPRLTMAYLNLGIVYGIVGKKEEASKMYRQCVEIDTAGLKDPRLHEHTKISALYNLGRLLADQEQYQEAIDVYKEAIQRRPSHYAPQSLYNMLGEAYAKLDDLDKAEHWYKEALAAKEDHIPAHLTMAKLSSRRGKAQEAEAWFSKAMRIDPTEGSIYQHYGQYLGEVGRYTEAADNYVRATQFTPEDFELIFNAANALRQANRNIEAEKFYKKAAKLRPNEATAHMNLGAMLHFNGKLEEAEQSYLMALKLKPDDTITRTNLNKLRNLIHKNGGGGAR